MRKKITLIILSVLLFVVLIRVFVSLQHVVPVATHIIFHPGASLKQEDNHTNIVLLGIGGGTHDGPDLTDTIIFVSIDWQKDTVHLVSIPRDLWVPSLSTYVKKINEVYAHGQDNTPPNGLSAAEKVVGQVTGQPVHYGVRLDFDGFVNGVDEIGGIDVQVARVLDDYNYPISGKEDETCNHTPDELKAFNATASAQIDTDIFNFYPCRYKHLHFDPGQQHMDGETALEFARSRHGVGVEGSDFARSARQQLVIEAVRNKLIASAFFNPGKLIGLFDVIKQSIDTDISDTDLGLFLDKLPQLKTAKILSSVLDDGDYISGRPGLLNLAPISPEYDNLSVQIPRAGNGNFSEIHTYILCELTKENCSVPVVSVTPSQVKKK